MSATHESIYQEIRYLRAEIQELKNLLIPEVEPEEDEVKAIHEGEKELKAGEYTDWKAVKPEFPSL